MVRMIDTSEATTIISDYFDAICDTKYTFDEAILLKLLDNKAIEAVPVRHGKWEVTPMYIKCSECGESFPLIPQNYCPNCGAKMDAEKK